MTLLRVISYYYIVTLVSNDDIDSLRRAVELLSELDSQFNSLKLVNKSPMRKKPQVEGSLGKTHRNLGKWWSKLRYGAAVDHKKSLNVVKISS